MSDIAINPVTRRVQFTGNTGTGPYAFTFNILVDGDIAVFKGTTELTLTTDYTVTINANGTGSITLTVALISSDVLTIIGGRELSRTTDFVTAGDLLASSLNEQLDSNVIMTQQLDEKLGRGLFVNPGDVFTDLELPLKDDRKGTVLGFNETTGDPEPGPTLSDVDSLATISADIKTLAEIQDGTVATDAITNVNTIRTDVSTVSGISSNVTTVAGNTSNINTVAGNDANITTVAGIDSDVTTVSGISSDVTTVAADGADIGVVAGLSSDIITVSGVSTEIGLLGTADAVSDMNTLAVAGIIADMDSLADNVSAISIVSDDIGYVIAVAINAANINTVAADGADIGTVATSIASVNTAATNIASINTNATNITDIQNASANAATATTQAGIATTQAGIATTKASEASASEVAAEAAKVAAEAALDEFTDIYLGAKASDPATDNDGNALTAGDQYFNTTINVLKIYNGSAWQAAAIDSSGFVETTGDTMTGALNVQSTITADGLTVNTTSAVTASFSRDGTDGDAVQIFNGAVGTTKALGLGVDGTHGTINSQYGGVKIQPAGTTSAFFGTGGDISFYDSAGTTAKMVWKAADERLGIGTSSPTTALDARGGVNSAHATFTGQASRGLVISTANTLSNDDGVIYNAQTASSGKHIFQIAGTEALRIDSSANVNLTGLSNGRLNFAGGNTSGGSKIQAWNDAGNANGYLAIEGYSSEYARFNSSGDLLVNTIASQSGIAKAAVQFDSGSQYGLEIKDAGIGTAGTFSIFYRGSTVVGSIGSIGGANLTIGTGDTGIRFVDSNDQIYPYNMSTNANRDASIDIGTSGARFKDLYLSGGVYLGGTGPSNKLDDYEEGLYTATLTPSASGSITLNGGYDQLSYTKVGRKVTVNGRVRVSSVSSPVGQMVRISLPFVVATLAEESERAVPTILVQNAAQDTSNYIGHPTGDGLSYTELGRSNSYGTNAAEDFSGDEYVSVNLTYFST